MAVSVRLLGWTMGGIGGGFSSRQRKQKLGKNDPFDMDVLKITGGRSMGKANLDLRRVRKENTLPRRISTATICRYL
jgi:hypothetical protein